jgi:hypothetical protein
MKAVIVVIMICTWMVGGCGVLNALAEPSSRDVLLKADESRGNLGGVEWEVSVLSKEADRTSEMGFFVQARGFDVLATTLTPPKDKGNKILLLNGNMWFHKPGLSKPVPISQRQKLLGIASYGDIASTNYANDYDATPERDEIVNQELCHVYDLKSKSTKTTYDRIRYWIARERLVGVKAEYFTLSGKIIKTATMEYAHSIQIEGNARPFISKISIRDVLMTSNETTLSFVKTNIKDIPDHVYNLNLLVK